MILNLNSSYADQAKIDSLKTVLTQASNDSTRSNTYEELGDQWQTTNPDSSVYHYKAALELIGEGKNPELAAKINNKLGAVYFYDLRSEEAIDYFNKSLTLAQATIMKEELLDIHYNIAYYYTRFENYVLSIENFKQAADYAIELNIEKRLAYIYNNLGLMYHYSADYGNAIFYNLKSLELKEKIGDNTIGLNHVNMALSYLKQENYNKAFEHNFIAIGIFEKAEKLNYIALTHKNIGDLHLDIHQLDSARYYYKKSFDYYNDVNDKTSIARLFMVMGNIDTKERLFRDAESKYQQALESLPENGSKKLRCALYSNISGLHMELAAGKTSNKTVNLNKALKYSGMMLSVSKEIGSLEHEVESLDKLYRTYELLNVKEQALIYAGKYIVARDSLFSEQKQKSILDLQTKYETEKKTYEIEFLNKENDMIAYKLSQSELLHKKQKTIIYLLVGGLLVISTLVFIIYRYYLLTKKSNHKLISQNRVITKQKEEKELLVQEIHHRVKNNLQIISSLFDLQLRSTEDITTKNALVDGLTRVKSVALLHELLHQNEDALNVDFSEFTNNLIGHIGKSFDEKKGFDFDINIPENVQFDIAKTIPLGLIINELTTNAFKYSAKNGDAGLISVKLHQENDAFKLEIKDQGEGLPEELDVTKSKSLGLRLVRTLSSQINGKLNYEYDEGAKFVLAFSA